MALDGCGQWLCVVMVTTGAWPLLSGVLYESLGDGVLGRWFSVVA